MYFITTDDLCVKFIPFWKETLDVLKSEFPALEITAFTTPVWQDKKEYDITESKVWLDFYEERKDWIHIGMHGYHHLKPKKDGDLFEGLMSYEDQLDLYSRSLDKLKEFMPKRWGFKPPFYHWNNDMLLALAELDCTWAHIESEFHLFKKDKIKFPGFIIESHVNNETSMPDRVDAIMTYLRWLLSNQLGNLNDLHIGKYGTINNFYQVARHQNEITWLNPSYYVENEARWFNERLQIRKG